MHRNGIITEGSSSNVFIVKDNVLYTHPATNLILRGITRQIVCQLAKAVGLAVKEETFLVEALHQADEVFITSTMMEVMPVRSIKGQIEKNYTIGPITLKLQNHFSQKIQALSKTTSTH